MAELSDADRIARLEAELEATQKVLAEALRVIVRAATIDSTKLRRGLDDMCNGWGGDDADPVHEAASIFATEVADEIQR